MKDLFKKPLFWVALALAGVIIYLLVKDGSVKVTTNIGSAAQPTPATLATVSAAPSPAASAA